MSQQELIGTITHWYGKIGVMAIELTGHLNTGDTIRVRGHTTDFEQQVTSMQIMHQEVTAVGPGDAVGIKAAQRARIGDRVYRVTQAE